MGKSSPSSPDPSALINAQVALATLGQQTPFGSLSFEGRRRIRIPDGPDAFMPETMRVNLTPAQRQILEQQQQAALLLGQSGIGLAGQLPTEPMAPFRPGDFEAARSAVEQAQFQRALNLLNPEFERQEGRLLQRLSNQGLPQTSRAFESEFGRFEDARNRALEEAALASVLAGGQEQSRLFGLDLATQQAVAAQRAQQLNEVLARLGLTQVQAPTFMPNPLAGVQVPITGQTGGGGSLGAGLAGGLSGAATGAQIGSMLGGPGVGTAIGGLLGLGAGLLG